MSEKPKIPRDQNVCFWCKYADHSVPACRRRAPAPFVKRYDDEAHYTVDFWTVIDLASDWCGEFEEGTCLDLLERVPQESDLSQEVAELAAVGGRVIER